MKLERIYVCTSKNSELYRFYLLQTGDSEKQAVYQNFEEDLNHKILSEDKMDKINGDALIEDIPYYVDFDDILEDSYLFSFKSEIENIVNNQAERIIQFSRFGKKGDGIKNFEENEGIKFLFLQEQESLYFLSIARNAVIKNKSIMSLSITEDSSVVEIPKGLQIPPAVTARLDRKLMRLFVYDVNRFESMLTLNENRKAKSQATIQKFISGEYTISSSKYKIIGLEDSVVSQKLYSSARAVRRLAKYQVPESNYSIDQIKTAVMKLDPHLQVSFDDNKKEIKVTQETAKTFVGIIHNIIVQRLISGDVEIVI